MQGMQPDGEKDKTTKEEINKPYAHKWCPHCDRIIPIAMKHQCGNRVCPLCGRQMLTIGEGTRKEWFGKHE